MGKKKRRGGNSNFGRLQTSADRGNILKRKERTNSKATGVTWKKKKIFFYEIGIIVERPKDRTVKRNRRLKYVRVFFHSIQRAHISK